jgi:hypothetical protein
MTCEPTAGMPCALSWEHRDGVAIVLVVPYSRSPVPDGVTFGEMTGNMGEAKVWAAR